MTTPDNHYSIFRNIGKGGIALLILGALLFMAGGILKLSSQTMLQSYLYAWVFMMMFTIGCYGFMLMYYMTRAAWGKPTIRILEAGARLLPVMLALFLPVMIWHGLIYPWANPELVRTDEILHNRSIWMNSSFWIFRTVAYFALWSGFTYYLTDLSRKQDASKDFRLETRRQKTSVAGFLLLVITLTLASTDWVMSLDKHWFSTMFGFLFVDFSGLAAISFVTLIVTSQKIAKKEPYNTLVTKVETRDLGNLLLMLTMIWAYFSLSQWLIIWSGNLPEETEFYLIRNKDAFLFVGAFNIVFSFFVPFVCLISGRTKRTPHLLMYVSVGLLLMRLIDSFWIVMPTMRYPGLVISDVGAVCILLGAWLFFHSAVIQQAPLIPNHETTVGAQEELVNV